jgi:hypothetical protein
MTGAVRLAILCLCLLAAVGARALSQPVKPIGIQRNFPICLLPETTDVRQCCFSTVRMAANLAESTSATRVRFSPDAQFPGSGDDPIRVYVYDMRDTVLNEVLSAGMLKLCAEFAYDYWKSRCPTIPKLTFKVVKNPPPSLRERIRQGGIDHCYLALVNFETFRFLDKSLPGDWAALRTPSPTTPIGPWRREDGWASASGVLIDERAHCSACSWLDAENNRLVIQHLSTTMLHEFGHWWGLDHTTSAAQLAEIEDARNAWVTQVSGGCPNEPCATGIMQEKIVEGWRPNLKPSEFTVVPDPTELELVSTVYSRVPLARYVDPVAPHGHESGP